MNSFLQGRIENYSKLQLIRDKLNYVIKLLEFLQSDSSLTFEEKIESNSWCDQLLQTLEFEFILDQNPGINLLRDSLYSTKYKNFRELLDAVGNADEIRKEVGQEISDLRIVDQNIIEHLIYKYSSLLESDEYFRYTNIERVSVLKEFKAYGKRIVETGSNPPLYLLLSQIDEKRPYFNSFTDRQINFIYNFLLNKIVEGAVYCIIINQLKQDFKAPHLKEELFEEYLNEKGIEILQFLKVKYTGSTVNKLVYMCFALDNLKVMNASNFFNNRTRAYRILQKTFAITGTRMTLSNTLDKRDNTDMDYKKEFDKKVNQEIINIQS